MTNEPLTAEDIVEDIRSSNTLDYFKAVDDIEAYAAQEVARFATSILHGVENHRQWLLDATYIGATITNPSIKAEKIDTMSDELKPCPFCGCSAVYAKTYDPDGCTWHYVRCLECGAQRRRIWAEDPCSQTYTELREDWNQRTPDPSLTRILKLAAIAIKQPLHCDDCPAVDGVTVVAEWHPCECKLNLAFRALNAQDHALLREISL
jgi:Lar family restriction alleviation protein